MVELMIAMPLEGRTRAMLEGLAEVEPEEARMKQAMNMAHLAAFVTGASDGSPRGWSEPMAVSAFKAALDHGPAPCVYCQRPVDPRDPRSPMVVVSGYDTAADAAAEIDLACSMACEGCVPSGSSGLETLLATHVEIMHAAKPGLCLIANVGRESALGAESRAERRRRERVEKKGGKPSSAMSTLQAAATGLPVKDLMRMDLIVADTPQSWGSIPSDCVGCGAEAGDGRQAISVRDAFAATGEMVVFRLCKACEAQVRAGGVDEMERMLRANPVGHALVGDP